MEYKRETSDKVKFMKVKNVWSMKDTIKKTKVNNRLGKKYLQHTYLYTKESYSEYRSLTTQE